MKTNSRKTLIAIIVIYGLLVAAGGVMGYLKAGSTASLSMGTIFGGLLVASGIAIHNHRYPVGWWVSLTLSTLLLVFFGFRFLAAFVFMPAGLMTLLSTFVIIALFYYRKTP